MQRLAVLQRRTITARLPSGRPARRAMSTHYQLWIDGRAVDAADGATLPIEDPSTGIAFATTALAGVSDVDAAVEAALRCHTTGAWRSKGAAGRGKVLRKAADLLRADLPSLVETEVRSTGRPVREFEAQLARVPEWLEYHASVAETAEGTIPRFGDAQDHLAIVRRRPLGVCGLITPWNHPLLIAVKKVSVALASANSVVLKAPELAPGSVLRLAQIISEAGAPPGAMNVVTGLGSVAGAALARHPSVSRIDFTGGNGAGRAIGAAAGAQLKSVCAELGGNCPVIVFADTDLEEAVNGVAFGAFLASGQTCVSAKRILVHASIFDAFRERLVQKAESLVMGPPMERTTHVGPLASEAALQQVESQIARAVSEGASLLTGGGRPPPSRCPLANSGHWCAPTVITNVLPHYACYQDEIFGPVVTLTPFGSDSSDSAEAEAVALANDNAYALGAAVWTSDVRRAHRVGERLQAGIIWVNAHHRNAPDAPWGGFGASGVGRENGIEAFREYTAPVTMIIKTADGGEDWFAGGHKARYN